MNGSDKSSNIAPPRGIKPALHEKSKTRRERLAQATGTRAAVPTGRNDPLPALQLTYVPIVSLRAANRRLRKKDPAQLARVARSIAEFGIVVPVIVDEELQIVHGHAVVDAARELGIAEVPVIKLEHLSKSQLRVLAITLNRLAETGVWDEEVLKIEFEELLALGEDLEVTGFAPQEVDILLLDEEDVEEPEAEEVPAPASIAVSKPGDLWKLGPHLLLQGDARDEESYETLMQPGEAARVVLTDTPYNVANVGHVTSQAHHREFAMAAGEMSREAFEGFICDWMSVAAAHVVDGGLVMSYIDWRSVDLMIESGRALDFELLNVIVWAKENAGQGSFWRSQHELLPVFKKGGAPHVNNVELGRHGRWRSNVWTYAGATTRGSDAQKELANHPTPKPRAMLEDALLDVSNRGEIVIDPFLGSGSTLLAAETTGRVCRAIEIDALYCDLAIRRWQALTGKQAVLAATGETFDDIAARGAQEPPEPAGPVGPGANDNVISLHSFGEMDHE